MADVRVASLRNPARELTAESPLALISSYLQGAATVAELEIRKLRHDPTELLTRAVQPASWLLIFGQAVSAIRAIPTGGISYLAFMTPGIRAQSVMFMSIFYGLTVIWDRDQGIVQKFLVMPVPRLSFVTGKALGAGVRALSQGLGRCAGYRVLGAVPNAGLDWLVLLSALLVAQLIAGVTFKTIVI